MATSVMAKCLWAFLCDLPKNDQTREKTKLNEQSDKQDTEELIKTQNTHIYIMSIIMQF